MKELIKRAFDVRDALRAYADFFMKNACKNCAYKENGCIDALKLDAAKVIERLIAEVDNGGN